MQTGEKGVKYGLQVRKPPQAGKPAPRPANIFGDDASDDEEDNVEAQIARHAARKQADQKVRAQAPPAHFTSQRTHRSHTALPSPRRLLSCRRLRWPRTPLSSTTIRTTTRSRRLALRRGDKRRSPANPATSPLS
jgi:hypothetical protein